MHHFTCLTPRRFSRRFFFEYSTQFVLVPSPFAFVSMKTDSSIYFSQHECKQKKHTQSCNKQLLTSFYPPIVLVLVLLPLKSYLLSSNKLDVLAGLLPTIEQQTDVPWNPFRVITISSNPSPKNYTLFDTRTSESSLEGKSFPHISREATATSTERYSTVLGSWMLKRTCGDT